MQFVLNRRRLVETMELAKRKRKCFGSSVCGEGLRSTSVIGSHLSLAGCSRRVKKCKEQNPDSTGSCRSRRWLGGVVTAPTCGGSMSECGRGHKRKIGCIAAATSTGRKKKLEQEYVLERDIGQGKFGSVRVCRSKASGIEFACKTMKKTGGECVHREVEIMQHLSGHPGVVTLQAVFESDECFHLVMELCSKGRLLDDMVKEGHYTEKKAANLLSDLMMVIKYCHDMGVVHRDIKPENILLSISGSLKLADFGLAVRISDGQSLSGLVGSPAYVAPEVLLGNYSEKVDIWSAGVLLHALLVGVLPFQGKSVDLLFEAIKTVKLDFHGGIWESISGPARDLLGRMLSRDASKRITADEVLRHPWIVFHTDRLLQTLTIKSKNKSFGGRSNFELSSRACLGRRVRAAKLLVEQDSFTSVSSESCSEGIQGEECSLVDALAAAISRVGISEPKRSRLCGPVNPIEQECSSNNANLCTAF